MPLTQWSSAQIKQCEKAIGQAMLRDESSLVSFSEDFGKLMSAKPHAVCTPETLEALQSLLRFANQQSLPVVIRGKGLSQGGQSLPAEGGITIHLEHFSRVLNQDEQGIWVEANASWSELLAASLPHLQVPYVVPYNTHLSIAGVISAGGVGAASFKYGSVTANVNALEVIRADGEKQVVDKHSQLFHACLAGQGCFAVITKACIALRSCKKKVRTFFLVYTDKNQWIADLERAGEIADGIESFCSPAIQGAKLTANGRFPFAQWLYALHIAVEYNDTAPELTDFKPVLKPWKVLHKQDESIESYYHRHDSRFTAMRLTGQWDLQHLWYECFLPAEVLFNQLDEVLAATPVHYANLLQVVPIANKTNRGFLMMPQTEKICGVMILNPGIAPALIPSCLAAMKALDARFLQAGGKRYLSGFLGKDISTEYWKKHYDEDYQNWLSLKNKYDPKAILRSHLFQTIGL